MSSVHKSEQKQAEPLFMLQASKVKEVTISKTKHFPRHLWPSVVGNMITNTTNAKKYCRQANRINYIKAHDPESAYNHRTDLLKAAREIYRDLDEEIDDYIGTGKMGDDFMYSWHVEIQKEIALLTGLLQSENKKFKEFTQSQST